MDCVEVAAQALKGFKGWLEECAKDGSRCKTRASFMLILNSLYFRMRKTRGRKICFCSGGRVT